MKKGEIHNGIVLRVDYPNKGRVQIEGEEEPVLVKNVHPGQKISLRLRKKRRGRWPYRTTGLLKIKKR